jgi:zinc/manganese transport system substrate-binding protein
MTQRGAIGLRPPAGTFARAAAALLVAALSAGCAVGSARRATAAEDGNRLSVVAAENIWGSIAAEIGGDRVRVRSIIRSPAADPHDYEPTAADARLLADAQVVIVNGIGYDPWAGRLVAASRAPGQRVVDVGRVVGQPIGGNPHRWYSPPDVSTVIDALTGLYQQLDPSGASYFSERRGQYLRVGLARYYELIASIRTRFAGAPVGASESIVAPLAPAVGLRLLTPSGFLAAVSDGSDPSAADKATSDRQIAQRQIQVYMYNAQNATPDVRRQVDAARAQGIPVVSVTETPPVPAAGFASWQVTQLEALLAALRQADVVAGHR